MYIYIYSMLYHRILHHHFQIKLSKKHRSHFFHVNKTHALFFVTYIYSKWESNFKVKKFALLDN